jgi:hypothetical protein
MRDDSVRIRTVYGRRISRDEALFDASVIYTMIAILIKSIHGV